MNSDEFRIVGPPGTGKTTTVASEVKHAVRRFGADSVLVASLTRAAAAEIAGRSLPIPREHIGTLHAHAYRALGGSPEIAEAHIADWNSYVANRQYAFRLTSSSKGGKGGVLDEEDYDDAPAGGTEGDRRAALVGLYRARLVPRPWPGQLEDFHNLWEEWKTESGLLDFTDLIELAYQNAEQAPGNPSALFLDEAQDSSKLEIALCRKWARHARVFISAGDADQAIFGFRGGDPSAFFGYDLPEGHVRVLQQSYRVPRAVHAAAAAWISQIRYREQVTYLPKDEPGFCHRVAFGLHNIEQEMRCVDHFLSQGKTVMILAACSYLLDPLKHALRSRGIPFHNPYRLRRHDWNPLHATRGTSSVERLLAFLRPYEEAWGTDARVWDTHDVRSWLSVVKTTDIMPRGGKRLMDSLPDHSPLPWEQLVGIFNARAMDDAIGGELPQAIAWLRDHMLSGKGAGMEFPIQIALSRGPRELRKPPSVILGTVHSVKGGESDVVIVHPDLSPAQHHDWLSRAPREAGTTSTPRDAIVRMFYVAMTRAKEGLILCGGAKANTFAQWGPIGESASYLPRGH